MTATVAEPTLTPVSADELEQLFQPAAVDEGVAALAEEADESLGYTVLKNKVERETLTPRDQHHLLAILREHCVPLYRARDVKRYQQAKVTSIMRPLERRARLWRFAFIIPWVAWIATAFAQEFKSVPIDSAAVQLPLLGLAVIAFIGAQVAKSRVRRTHAHWNGFTLG